MDSLDWTLRITAANKGATLRVRILSLFRFRGMVSVMTSSLSAEASMRSMALPERTKLVVVLV